MSPETEDEAETIPPPEWRGARIVFADTISPGRAFFVMLYAMADVRTMVRALSRTLAPAREPAAIAPGARFAIPSRQRQGAATCPFTRRIETGILAFVGEA